MISSGYQPPSAKVATQPNYNLLFRWFVGLNMDDPVWHPTTFTKNRDRLLSGDVAAAFFDAVQAHARAAGLLSDEHFTVDGTQLEAWASLKSFRCVDAAESDPPEDPGNPTVNFHGERRRNDTHQSTTDPEAMLHRKGKGKEAKLAYLGHVLLDNRQGLVANVCATHATGTAERDAAVLLLEASASPGSTVGADKGYDVARFVADVRVQDVTPHVAQKVRGSAIDGRTTRHAGYHVSQRKRKLGCFRHQLLPPRPYLILTKPLRLDIQCQRGASVKIGWKYLDD